MFIKSFAGAVVPHNHIHLGGIETLNAVAPGGIFITLKPEALSGADQQDTVPEAVKTRLVERYRRLHEKQLRSVWLDAAKAKQNFDQLKVDYDNESKVKKEELDQQRARVKALESSVDRDLLNEYLTIKKHITPPVARLAYGQCSGCNTSLPSATLSKIKNGNLVECETCGRMIIQ